MPSSIIALAIVAVAVLPGSMYTWAYERQASAFGVTFADRTLRFIAISLIFHLVLAWPEYGLYRAVFKSEAFGAAQFAILWVGLLILVGLPASIGTVLGGLYTTRSNRERWSRLRKHLTAENEDRLLTFALGRTAAPRAWDHFFSDSPTTALRVALTDGTVVAGVFANKSYAGGYPHEADLLLEEAWSLDDKEQLVRPLGYPVYLPASQIAWIDIIPQADPSPEDGSDDAAPEN